MLRGLIATSLRQPTLVLAAAAAVLIASVGSLRNAPLDVFPEFAPPLVEIQTERRDFRPKRSKRWYRCRWRTR